MTTVGIAYDRMESATELQILRDLMTISASHEIKIHDYGGKIDPALLAQAGFELTTLQPELYIRYKVGDSYPEIENEWDLNGYAIPVVDRDLQVHVREGLVRENAEPGYYLKEQGRPGANLTELYLNRMRPQGKGVSDALIVYMWG